MKHLSEKEENIIHEATMEKPPLNTLSLPFYLHFINKCLFYHIRDEFMVEQEGFFKAKSLIGQLVTAENLTKDRCWRF